MIFFFLTVSLLHLPIFPKPPPITKIPGKWELIEVEYTVGKFKGAYYARRFNEKNLPTALNSKEVILDRTFLKQMVAIHLPLKNIATKMDISDSYFDLIK